MLAVDDGLPQGYAQNESQSLPEFPIVLQSRQYPISAWLTHPECPFTKFYQDGQESSVQVPTSQLEDSSYHVLSPDLAQYDMLKTRAYKLSEGFTSQCSDY